METGVRETRRDAEEIERRFQKSFAEAVPFQVEIFKDAILRERNGREGFTLMCEDSGINRFDTERCRVVYKRLVENHLIGIALFHVEKVDLPSIHVRNL